MKKRVQNQKTGFYSKSKNEEYEIPNSGQKTSEYFDKLLRHKKIMLIIKLAFVLLMALLLRIFGPKVIDLRTNNLEKTFKWFSEIRSP
jgi:hypothetical protein